MADDLRAVLYARLSQDRQGNQEGVTRQLDDARQLAALRRLTVTAEYVDNDTSASGKVVRPGFEKLITAIEAGEASVVIAWNWDRLSRNRRDTLRLIEVGQSTNLTIALVRGSDLDMSTASGRLVADLLAGVARNEIDTKRERQQRAGLQRAQAGKPPSRRAFGYHGDGTQNRREAAAVKRVYSSFLTGASITRLAQQLNEQGFTSTRGKPWDDTALRVVLTNPRYVGQRWYHGAYVGEGEWKPIITAATFEAVQAVFRSKRPRRPASKHLGAGLFRCGICGGPVTTSYDAQTERIYRCRTFSHLARRAEQVDDFVRRVIAARLRKADLADLLAAERPDVDVAGLQREAVALREQRDQLGVDLARRLLTAGQVRVATEVLDADLAAIEAQLAEAGRESALQPLLNAKDPGQAWLDLDLDRQRAALDALATVTILKARPGRPPVDPDTGLKTFDVSTVDIQPKS